MRFRHSLALATLAAFVTLAACVPGAGIGPNPFAGCYDKSCVDAPAHVPVVPPLVSISGAIAHTCGLTADGDAWCWGANAVGQLGDGTTAPRQTPVKVTGGHRFTAITTGNGFTCALDASGGAWCWGSGALGAPAPERCGPGQAPCATQPLSLGERTYRAIAAGVRHACAVDAEGVAHCWGFNFLGEVGSAAYGTTIPSPRIVSSAAPFVSIHAGDAYTCALTDEGQAWCWGSANRGTLGRAVPACNSVAGFANHCTPVPGPASTGARFVMLSTGMGHACGLTAQGVAHCWGDNGQGQLGAGEYRVYDTPLVAQGGRTFSTIVASSPTTCGTPASGGASVCWGLNIFGKLGVGSRIELSREPLANAGNLRFTRMNGGEYHMCGLVADGAAYCWGYGRDGQLGSGAKAP